MIGGQRIALVALHTWLEQPLLSAAKPIAVDEEMESRSVEQLDLNSILVWKPSRSPDDLPAQLRQQNAEFRRESKSDGFRSGADPSTQAGLASMSTCET